MSSQFTRDRGVQLLALVVVLSVVAWSLASCGNTGSALSSAADPSRIQAYSEGLVPSGAAIKVVLTSARGGRGAEAPRGSLSLEPSVKGRAIWEDENTIAFIPSSPLARGKTYTGILDFGCLDGKSESGKDLFKFKVHVAHQVINVVTLPPRVANDASVSVEGSVSLADGVSSEAVEKAFSVSAGSVSWVHSGDCLHRFTVSGLRAGDRSDLVVRWDGRSLGGTSGQTKVKLPSKEFALIAARPLGADEGTKGIELAFSKPIDKSQDLRGLVSVEGVDDIRYSVAGSAVRLYAASWPVSAKVRVERGLKESGGGALAVPVAASVNFAWEKPEVRFLTKGTILPTDQGLVVPIETMNLAAVTVEALRVYGDNMLQFLQVNDLDTSRELGRVGEIVWRKKINLEWKDDWKNRWVRHGLELGQLLAAHKDGMFQIRVTFRKDDIRYVCPENHDFKDLRFPEDRVIDRDENEFSFWNFIEEWGENGYDDYYKYKNDPCHPAFYIPSYDHDISIRRNVVISDIGAAVKRESDGTWHVAASDLRTTKPISGAQVALFNYQRRQLASGLTGPNGIAVLKTEAVPSFATVQNGSQTSWLKVDEGSVLSIGHFDVGGEKVDGGLKGFIYGERGVWRPGDDIHLTFALYDREGRLPAKYPISFELEDPLGRVVRSGVYTESVGGFYAITTNTTADAPTGSYTARVKAGGKTFSKTVKVETVMPNRLKIELNWGAEPYLSADTRSVNLAASWLTGAKAGALKADVSATFAPASSAFPGLPDFSFSDPTREVSSDRVILFDGRLKNDGTTSFNLDLGSSYDSPPGKLTANILTRVFEPSGVFSSEFVTADFHPYERYIGVKLPKGDAARGMLLTDKDQRVDLILVDRDGKPVTRGAEIEVAIYKLEWRWWWEKGEESLAERAHEILQRPIKKDTVKVGPDGRASWTFQIKSPDWGRFFVRAVDKSGGHAAGKQVYIDWPGWAGRGRESGGSEAMLELTVGAAKYAPGAKASVTFPSNADGRALVTIERAGRVLREEWVQTKKETTLYEFTVTPEMAPNVYVHVTFVQPHLQTANDLPIRLYGIVPVMVEDPATRLKPVITTAETLVPGGKASFTVREEKGRPMTYTVAVVDEGLLGITRYKTPDPWDEFYKKEASSLSSWDLYQYVAGAYSGKLETLLAVGGSDEGVGGGNRKPSRFPAVVYYFPPKTLGAGESATESFTLGPYIGALRFMVVAGAIPAPGSAQGSSSGAAFGAVERSVPVKTDIMAQLTAPRLLSPGEEASIPATVFSFMGKARASVSLSASGALSLVGEAVKYIDFKQDGDLATSFKIRAADSPGRGRLVLTASIGGKKAEQAIDLEVRSVGIPVSEVTALGLEARKTWSGAVKLPGSSGTNTLALEVSKLKPIDLTDRLTWLLQYPHGCAEQITSAAFPQLYLPKAASLDAEQAELSKANVISVIDRLRGYQTNRGSFSLWPGSNRADEWVSAYVVHFLLSAKREGFDVPSGLMDSALDYLSRSAKAWNSSEPWSISTQAYRLYCLALAGRSEIAAMNRLRDSPNMPTAARFRLGAAYALSGMREAASSLTRGAAPEAGDYPDMLERTYGSPTRDSAVILDALNAMGDTTRALAVYNKLADELSSRRWMSTQEIGCALQAAQSYAIMAASSSSAPEITVSSSDGGWTRSFTVEKVMAKYDLPAPSGGQIALKLENKGSTPVFVRLVARGIPQPGSERAVSNGVSLSIKYLTMDGRSVDPAKLKQGEDYIIETTVKNRSGRDIKNMALTQLVPSGWEIANYRIGAELPNPKKEDRDSSRKKEEPLYDYQDRRDDRVLTYFDLGAKDTKVFTVYVNATYEGDFFLPATRLECMYDPTFSAVSPGRWLSGAAPVKGSGALTPRSSGSKEQ